MACPLYDISRTQQRGGTTVFLDSKTKNNLFWESTSRLELRQTRALETNTWELYYHRNYEFVSFVRVPAPGSQVILIFDSSCSWCERNGKVVAEEERAGTYQKQQGLKAGADLTKLPRIAISGGLDQRFVDLIVACWAAKAYFP
jgi:hypothetical protein